MIQDIAPDRLDNAYANHTPRAEDPILAFGNSTGDFAMANAALHNPNYHGEAFMLLCDNTEQDYGDPKVAEEFAAKCKDAGYTTVSMAKDWTTIYGDGVKKVEPKAEELPAAA